MTAKDDGKSEKELLMDMLDETRRKDAKDDRRWEEVRRHMNLTALQLDQTHDGDESLRRLEGHLKWNNRIAMGFFVSACLVLLLASCGD